MGKLYPVSSKSIDEIYLNLCTSLLADGKRVANTRELNNVMVELTDITKNIVSIRGISPSYLFGEMLWYFTGRRDTKFISKFSKFWDRISDDGINANSAYGYLIHKAFGFDQVEKVIDILKADPNSRRAKININTPRENVDTTLDEPCTMFLDFMIRDGKLNCTAVMRSNDIWFGFPYDVAFFTELQKMIADKLEVGYGAYTHFACSLHMYDKDYENIGKIVEHPVSKSIKFNRVAFFEHYDTIADQIEHVGSYWSDNNPKKYLMYLLKIYGIYKEDDNEN